MRIRIGILLAALMISGTACTKKQTKVKTPPAVQATVQANQSSTPPPTTTPARKTGGGGRDSIQTADTQDVSPPPPPAVTPSATASQPITTALPLADYYVCRFTPQQARAFTFQDAYQQILLAVNRFMSKKTDADRADAQNLVYSFAPTDADGMVKALTDKLIDKPYVAALTYQIKNANAMAGTNSAITVGCSQSLLTWNETRHMFGRAIADNYLAIQVNVRNLDGDNQFLLHDSQVAFWDKVKDAGTDPLFVGGRDRVLARGLQQATTWNSPRNLAVLLASAVGSLGTAAGAVTGGPALATAFSVFNSSFVPLLAGKVPDLSVAQLRMMDDMAYSSANAYHIVVPTKGTVPFVTFVPLSVYVDTLQAFKQMVPDDLKKLADRMYVIVAGVHITEVNPAVGLTKFNCPANNGALDLSNTADVAQTQFVCTVTGTSLNSIAKIKLINAKDSSDTVAPEGALSVDGGSTTSGKATFDVSALSQLAGSQYDAVLVSSNGQETTTSQMVTLAPVVVSASLQLSGCGVNQQCQIQLTGSNLGLLDSAVTLTIGGAQIAGATLTAGSALTRSVSFASPSTAVTASSQFALALTAGGKTIAAPSVTVH